MSNRLADEQSPYLLQHKDNPVDWYPWSDEAFETARREDKPIFLSIGYSTCHWCHVMEHESFEDEEVAALMNDAFVSIKVDREERPDVDGVYMTACQMMTGQGGWPLSVFMTPERKPFHVATYIPKHGRFGRAGMIDLIPRIDEAWKNRRDEVMEAASSVVASLQGRSTAPARGSEPTAERLDDAFGALRGRYDAEFGGFGDAPKFPSLHNLLFLLRYWRRTGRKEALDMVEKTLDHMRRGGLYDHIGFGFHRYSTDRRWLLPHFEKMMYDQALHAATYVEAWQATGRKLFKLTAEEIIQYVLRDMTSENGAFYSAEDADSEGREGAFYLWTTDEVRELLPDEDAAYAIDTFHLRDEGNFEEEASGSQTGENVLHLRRSAEEAADSGPLERIRNTLFEAREERVRPGRDDKILTDWNGLMIAALSKASVAFGDDRYANEARRAAAFLLEVMRDDKGNLLHRYRSGEAAVTGMLDDYAYFIWGLVELYEASFETTYLREAVRLQDQQIARFWDDDEGGFFFTARDAEALIMRRKEFHDGALPSANAVSVLNMLRLARMTGKVELEDRAAQVLDAAAAGLERMPAGFTAMLAALDFALGPTAEVVVAEGEDAAETEALLRVVRESFRPRHVVLFNRARGSELEEIAPFAAGQTARNGRAAVYVCRDFQCEAPVSDVDELRRVLEES